MTPLMTITLPELRDTPPSVNQLIGRSGFKWRKHLKQWRDDVGTLLLAERPGLPRPLPGLVVVSASLRFPDKRRRDSDNAAVVLAKACGDALQDVGLIEDDTHDRYRFAGVTFEDERGPRRTTIRIEVHA